MKHRHTFPMLLVCIFIFSLVLPCAAAAENTESAGIYHEDGSYQFSEDEVVRLNEYLSSATNARSTTPTMAEVIGYASPASYSLLSQSAKDYLAAIPWESTSTSGEISTYNINYYATISKYGSSLKGYSYISRPNSEYLVAVCAVCEYPEQNNYVGYSYNIEEPAVSGGTVSSCSATTIIDPPSGTYWAVGQFEHPYYDSGWHILTYRSTSSTLSYVNPNG